MLHKTRSVRLKGSHPVTEFSTLSLLCLLQILGHLHAGLIIEPVVSPKLIYWFNQRKELKSMTGIEKPASLTRVELQRESAMPAIRCEVRWNFADLGGYSAFLSSYYTCISTWSIVRSFARRRLGSAGVGWQTAWAQYLLVPYKCRHA